MLKILESIVYLLSSLFLIISFIRLKKSNEKLNLIHWIVISLLLLFCYNSLVALVLSTFNIPVYLIYVSIVNVVISIILLKVKHQEHQEYFILKKDIITSIIIIITTLIIMLVRFGIPFSITYETCDPGIHFWTAKDFYEQSFLLNKVTDKTVVNFETRQAASYTNVGLLFKMVGPFTDSFNLYIYYIIYDLYMFILAGMSFYILISDTKSKGKYLLSLALSLLYVLGYPLNNMVFGFFYSGHAVTLISLIFILIKYYDITKFNNKMLYYLLGLTCYGLFFTYYFYAPVVFIAMFIYMTYKDVKNGKKIISTEFISKNLIIFLAACLLGTLYYIVPNIGNENTSIQAQINLNGYYYNNVFSNFTLLIPIIFLSFMLMRKNKDLKLEHIMLIMLLVFMSIILYLMFESLAVGYYLSKNYYLLWLIAFIIFSNFMLENYDKYKYPVLAYISFIVLIIISTITNFEQKIIDTEEWDINLTTPSNMFYVYKFNYDMIMYEAPDFTVEELKMLHEIYEMGAKDLQNNASYNLVDRRAWIAAWFRKTPITLTTENKLFSYLTLNDYIEIIPDYDDTSEFDSDKINYFPINVSGYNWFLLMYNRNNSKRRGAKQESNLIEGKKYYDKIDRSTCASCTFYDFDDGLLIYKNGGMILYD